MKSRGTVIYRILFGLLGFTALVTEVATIVERDAFDPWHVFSFFTIESNILAVVALIVGALFAASGKIPRGFELFRGAVTLYMTITGIIFALLLSHLDSLTATPWDNIVLHYIMPAAILLDWFVWRPKVRISFKLSLVWLVYPLVYLAYSLIRGSIVNWYPYPFLNPSMSSITTIVVTCLGVAVFAVIVGWLLSLVTRIKVAK